MWNDTLLPSDIKMILSMWSVYSFKCYLKNSAQIQIFYYLHQLIGLVDPGFVIWAVFSTALEFTSVLISIIYLNILRKYEHVNLNSMHWLWSPMPRSSAHYSFSSSEAGIPKESLRNNLSFTWGWAEVLSIAHIVQILNWVAWPELFSLSLLCVMHRGARPQVSLRWQDPRSNSASANSIKYIYLHYTWHLDFS